MTFLLKNPTNAMHPLQALLRNNHHHHRSTDLPPRPSASWERVSGTCMEA
jgi:hypothetical protein